MVNPRTRARIAREIQRKTARILLEEFDDPRFTRVTVLEVFLARNLNSAYIIFSVLGETNPSGEMKALLHRAAGRIAHSLGRSLRLKRVPRLYFLAPDDPEVPRLRLKHR